MSLAIPAATFVLPASRWRTHLVALALVAAALLALFARDAADMVRIWWTSSAYGHCLVVGPIIGWLVWQRRAELARLDPVAWWPGLLAVAAGGTAWWMGSAAAVALARQFGLLAMLVGSVSTLLGPRVTRGLAFPLAYAVFLVPFGDWLEAPLQQVTVALVMPLLSLAGIPATANGVMIHAGRYWFEVAEACSGAKFVLAMTAFGVLVARVGFTRWRRRAAFLAACLVVPVLANGVRAFATIWLADRTSIEVAGGFDHIVYGWVFFALVIAAMLAVAWRRFDRAPDEPAFDPAALQGPVRHAVPLAAAVLLALATAASFPAWAGIAAGRSAPLAPRATLPRVPGWHRVAPTSFPWRPWYPGADRDLMARYADAQGHAVDLAIAAYARQGEGRELVGYGVGVLREDDRWLRVADLPPIAGGSAMRITAPSPADRVVASWYRIGDTLTADPVRVKWQTLEARLLARPQRAVAIHVSAEALPGTDPAATIRAFLAAAGPLDRLADRAVAP